MPIVENELLYRRTQRQLGEIQVALKLALGVAKALPNLEGIEASCFSLLSAKNAIMKSIFEMEDGQ